MKLMYRRKSERPSEGGWRYSSRFDYDFDDGARRWQLLDLLQTSLTERPKYLKV